MPDTMEILKIVGTAKTPTIELNPSGVLVLEGRSIPEDSIEFYKPVVDWLTEYSKSPSDVTELQVRLEYFNTSSSKCILDIFKRLDAVMQGGGKVVVKWFYGEDDEDMREAGEDYQEIVKIPFQLISR